MRCVTVLCSTAYVVKEPLSGNRERYIYRVGQKSDTFRTLYSLMFLVLVWRVVIVHRHSRPKVYASRKREAQLPQTDRATRFVSKFVICFTRYHGS